MDNFAALIQPLYIKIGNYNFDENLVLRLDLDLDIHPSSVDFDVSIGRLTLAAMGGSVMHGDQPLRSSLPLIIDQSAWFI